MLVSYSNLSVSERYSELVYWKPTILWIIDKVRIINKIKTQTQSIKPINYVGGGSSLSIYTYLSDVEYQVQAHFEWNMNRHDLEKDRNENKHYFVTKRMIERGGRRDIFLGARECQGEPGNPANLVRVMDFMTATECLHSI